uniref:Dehydrogenase/reductase (SDR family) member 9 n=2 Tax=Erpetoichthys calabaricus TaxID=27687 RepID=A0A8C4SF39_ERPCA
MYKFSSFFLDSTKTESIRPCLIVNVKSVSSCGLLKYFHLFFSEMILCLLSLVTIFLLCRWLRARKRVSGISNKYVFITGCDSGFGNLLAKHLDQLGFRVFAGCFTEKGEDELKKTTSEKLVTVHLDVTKSESIQRAIELVKTQVGQAGLWGLVNNAAVGIPVGPCDWLNVQEFRSMFDVNFFGLVEVTLGFVPLIKKAKGRIVNMSSMCARVSTPAAPYCATKSAVESFTDSLRKNMAYFGIKVSCIEPGFFKTSIITSELFKSNLEQLWERQTEELKEDYGRNYLEKVVKNVGKQIDNYSDPDLMKVVSCMEHAVSAEHPWTRYAPGWDARFFWIPLSYMPTVIIDYVFSRTMITPAKSVY